MSTDDNDIKREMSNLYARTNMLIRRFSSRWINVKLMLIKSFCLCLYTTLLYGLNLKTVAYGTDWKLATTNA